MALRRIARWIAGRAPGWSDAGGALPLFTAPWIPRSRPLRR